MELENMGELNFFSGSINTNRKKDLQILFVIDGNGRITSDQVSSKIEKRDLFVINSGNTIKFTGKGHLAILSIDKNLLHFFQIYESIIICTPSERENVAYQSMSNMISDFINPCLDENQKDQIRLALVRIIDFLEKNFSVEINKLNWNLMDKVKDYVDRNYFEPLTLVDISSQVKRSPQYISASFKQHFGINIMDYLNSIRLKSTIEELLNTDKTVVDIALDNGFSTIVTFNRNFKRVYHQTPTDYRKNNKVVNDTNNSDSTKELNQQIKNELKIDSNEEVIAIEPNNKQMFNQFWDDRYSFERNEYEGEVLNKISKLSSEFIIFDISKPNSKFVESDLVWMEKKLDWYLRRRMRPIFKFSVNNQWLNDAKFESTISYNVGIILKHFANIVSIRNIKGWKFEFQLDEIVEKNEFNNLMHNVKKICKFYNNDCNIVIAGSFKVLHSMLSIGTDVDYSMDVEQTVKEEGLDETNTLLSSLILDIREMKKEMSNQELYLENLYLVPKSQKLLNDTEFFGSIFLRLVFETWGLVDGIGLFQIQDDESIEENSFLNGQRGLFSTEGISKPIYYVIQFLNKIGQYYISNTNSTLVTFDGFNDYSIVSTGYNPIKYNEYGLNYSNYQGIFGSPYKKIIHYNFKNIKNGVYRIKLRKVNSNFGNIIDAWRQLNFITSLSTSELNFLKNASQPDLSMKDIEVVDNTYSCELKLKSNEIVYLHLIYRY